MINKIINTRKYNRSVKMGLIISFMGNVVGSVIKYTFYTSILIIAGAGVFAYNTKPKNDTFKKYLENNMKDNANPKSVVENIAVYAGSKIYTNVLSDYDIKDYIFLKLVINRAMNNKSAYIGAFNQWFEL